MYNITGLLQNEIRALFTIFKDAGREAKSIYDGYWKTDANTKVTGLSSGTDPATVETHLTKDEYANGITLCEELDDFFTNSAVTTTDFLQHATRCKYGSAGTLATQLSNATEKIGTRLYDLCTVLIDALETALNIIDLYYDNEVGDIVSALDDQRIIFGSEMTKTDLVNAITLLEQFENFMNNSVVTTADYFATIAKWDRLTTINL